MKAALGARWAGCGGGEGCYWKSGRSSAASAAISSGVRGLRSLSRSRCSPPLRHAKAHFRQAWSSREGVSRCEQGLAAA